MAETSNVSKPYAFSFDTKTKPGKVIAHCVRFETIEVAESEKEYEFTTCGRDINRDYRQSQFIMTVKSILVQE